MDGRGRGEDRKERERGNLPEEHLFFKVKEAKLLRVEPLPRNTLPQEAVKGIRSASGNHLD